MVNEHSCSAPLWRSECIHITSPPAIEHLIVRISGGPCPHYQTFMVYKLGVHARKSCRLIHSAPFTRRPPSYIPVAVQSTLFHTTIYRKKRLRKKIRSFTTGAYGRCITLYAYTERYVATFCWGYKLGAFLTIYIKKQLKP